MQESGVGHGNIVWKCGRGVGRVTEKKCSVRFFRENFAKLP